jgi:PEP-CTERM motif
MRLHIASLALLATTAMFTAAAHADVIAGPVLNADGVSWTDTGIAFTATVNTALTSFVFQNQGGADTVDLYNAAGVVLDSLSTPAGQTSYTASVNWALTAGQQYYLGQTVASNELFASYGLPLPSDGQIAIDFSGYFGYGLPPADEAGWTANEYWAGFNNITTGASVSTTPEPSSLALLGTGALALAGSIRRRMNR